MTEPTDAELDELRQANSGRLNFVTLSEFRTIARAVLARWGAQDVPAGYALVPVEPTPEMVDAAQEAYMPFGDMQLAIQLAIAAAPQPSPTAQAADSVLEDAARYRYLRDGDWREHEELESVIRLQLNTLWDAKIDAARAAQEGKSHGN